MSHDSINALWAIAGMLVGGVLGQVLYFLGPEWWRALKRWWNS